MMMMMKEKPLFVHSTKYYYLISVVFTITKGNCRPGSLAESFAYIREEASENHSLLLLQDF